MRLTENPARQNPAPPPPEGTFLTRFVGSGIEVGIARYYYDREYDVYNIQTPSDLEPFPWFANISKFSDALGKAITRPIGYASDAIVGAVQARKDVAEMWNGGVAGDLWVLRLVSSSPLTYEAEILSLHPESHPRRWTVEGTETLVVKD